MNVRPILFSAPMVRALLEGRKTQTRRILHDMPLQPATDCHPEHTQKHPAPYLDSYCNGEQNELNPRRMSERWCWWQVDDRQCLPTFKVPYVPGDLLWVRERFGDCPECGYLNLREGINRPSNCAACDAYIAKFKPSIHMPRRASRITLEVTEVRVQRLQDVSEEDAIAEGATSMPGDWPEPDWSMDWSEIGKWSRSKGAALEQRDIALGSARWAFASYWDEINGDASWDANPWITAITFKPHFCNVDDLLKQRDAT